jgi:acyl phosphate:glycerol-3-phosphate acyltransferase
MILSGSEESLRNVILQGLGAYLDASVNFSIILLKVLNKGDPRDNLSGNAGTVNVARQLGKLWGLLILLLDMARAGAIAQVGFVFCLPR